MYGTIAKMRIKPGKEQELDQMSREHAPETPGFVFQHVYRLDNDPQSVFMAVGFTDKDAYRANAGSPEQHTRYEQYRALLDSDPEWNDGEIIFSVEQ